MLYLNLKIYNNLFTIGLNILLNKILSFSIEIVDTDKSIWFSKTLKYYR